MTAMAPAEPTAPTRTRRVLDAVDERLGLNALQYEVPEHANNLAWSLGGLTAASLGILIVTGIVLTQFYNPSPDVANASVRHIVLVVWGGWFIRGLHFWAAQAMYVLAALHLLRVFATGSFKRPREGNWLIGVAMFALVIGALFTGTVLKWDQEGFEALTHNLEIGRLLGGAGFWFSDEFSHDFPLLIRLFVAHVAIIPGLILGLFAFHAVLVKRHGISPSPSVPDAPRESREPFTHHLRRLGALALVLLGALGVLAVLFPPEVGPAPVEGIEVTKPLWMFWWLFTLEDRWGVKAILWGSIVLFALLVAVPFLDRSPQRSLRKRPVAAVILAVVLAVYVALTLITAFTSSSAHLE
jgi:ubiquinol-cytochrome c reductase cytochrome b subunit